MDIKQKTIGNKNLFYLEEGGQTTACLYFQLQNGTEIVIEHTEVDSAFEGRGLGKRLLMSVVDFAREKKYKIIPVCPYAKKVLTKTTEFADVMV